MDGYWNDMIVLCVVNLILTICIRRCVCLCVCSVHGFMCCCCCCCWVVGLAVIRHNNVKCMLQCQNGISQLLRVSMASMLCVWDKTMKMSYKCHVDDMYLLMHVSLAKTFWFSKICNFLKAHELRQTIALRRTRRRGKSSFPGIRIEIRARRRC